jgi:tetratricopeptide (TPR) repeat protein
MNFDHFRDYRLNVRFLGFWLVMLLVLAVGGGVLHRFQLQRLGAAYLDQSKMARESDQPARELDYLLRYLTLEPGDGDARLRSAQLQARLATRPRDRVAAFQTYQAALRANPNLPAAIRLQAIKLALHPSLRLADEARFYVEELLKAEPTNPEYAMLMAECYLIGRDFKKAEEYLAAVVKGDPKNVTAFAQLAALQRFEFRRLEEADATMAALAEQNPKSAPAFIAVAEYWRRAGKRDAYAAAVAKARELDPNDPEVVLTAADYTLTLADDGPTTAVPAERKAKVDVAVKLYESALAAVVPLLPKSDAPPEPGGRGEKLQGLASRAYHTLVTLLTQEGRPAEAEEWARRQAATFPGSTLGQIDLADAAIVQGKLDEAEGVVGTLRRAGYPSGQLDFLTGRIDVLRGHWPQACRTLESAIEGLADSPELSRRANLLLALCYRETGELDRRYEAFRRAVPPEPLDPTWGAAVQGVAEALTDLGRPNDALAEYTRLATVYPGANVPLGRLLLSQAFRLPASQRDFSAVERALAAAPAGPETELLRAEVTAARSTTEAARPVLARAVAASPESIRLWVARVLLELRVDNPLRAAELLDEAKAKLGDKVELRLARAQLLVAGPAPAAATGLEKLAEDTKKFGPQDRNSLLRTLAAAAEQVSRPDLARRWLDQLAAERPDDISLMTSRFDLALKAGDETAVTQLMADVARVSGGDETVQSRVLRAFYLLWKGDREKNPATIAEAAGLLAGLERRRPGWSRLYVAQGRAADLAGDHATAARRYRQAVDLGDGSPEIVRRLLELYYLTRQYPEAEELMRQAPNTRLSGMGAELVAELSLSSKNYGRALELARQAVKADSSDPAKLLWLARVTALSGELAAAEAPLRRAVELAPKRADAWVALVQLLAALKKPAEAKAAMEACRAQADPKDAALAMAQCAETLGQADDAAKLYAEALAAQPTDPAVLRAVAAHRLRRGDAAGARKLLEELLTLQSKSKDDEQFARRLLATILAMSNDYLTTQRALAVLGLATPDAAAQVTGGEPLEDLRARVNVLARLRGRKSRQSALRLLEVMEARQPLTPDDLRGRAGLEEALGEWGKARASYAAALTAAGSPTAWLADYVARLLRHGDTAEAKKALARLKEREPTADATVALEVQQAAAEGDKAGAVAAANRITQPEAAAVALERAGLLAEAESKYRQYADTANTDAARLTLAGYLGRVGNFSGGWAELSKLWDKLPPESSVPVACELLLGNAAAAPPAEVKQLLGRVEAAAAAKPSLGGYAAVAESLAGDQSKALALNRKVLAEDPNNLLALNNQAYLLAAVEKDYPAALELLKRAKEVAGPLPGLLDTEGVVLLLAGEPQKAAEMFRESLIEERGPVATLHLAQAYLAAGRLLEAGAALADARRLNLRLGELHPLEQPAAAKAIAEIDAR